MERDDIGLDSANQAVAVVGVAAILPDAPNAAAFWNNIVGGVDSIREVPADRWDPKDYWNPDPSVPNKTYSKIGAFVRDFTFDSLKFRIPPKIAASLDIVQQWMLVTAREALLDAGHPEKSKIDPTRTGVVFGNALGGELRNWTTLRILLPSIANALREVPELKSMPEATRDAIVKGMLDKAYAFLPEITEDTMPGELSNVIAGRVTNVLDLAGPNFTTDAACASSLAALQSAVGLLATRKVDAVVTGGVDRTMDPPTYTKFSKIGALSADGSRPFDAGANGFVMGEGCVALVLRRLDDAERDGNKIYAVIRGIGGSSDGKGKGITAPNPQGQLYSLARAYEDACVSPRGTGLIEAHGTSTSVGDAIELGALTKAFDGLGLAPRSIAIGSIKSQIGHLKSGAGAAGLLKAILAVHHKVLPPSINFRVPNPNVDWAKVPFYVNTQATPWERPATGVRRAGVSSFGFGGTNFHIVVDEHVPGMLTKAAKPKGTPQQLDGDARSERTASVDPDQPLRGLAAIGGRDAAELATKLEAVLADAKAGKLPPREAPSAQMLSSPERLVIDFGTAEELLDRGDKALQALRANDPRTFKALRGRGVFRGSGPAQKVAFLFPGQGSQYLGMLQKMREAIPAVREIFEHADQTMAQHLPKKLSDYILDVDGGEKADLALRDTQVCQPAVLTVDAALAEMLRRYGVVPDMVMGHSLGEYGALVSARAMPFSHALLAVSARAREMSSVSIADNGKMASIFAPYDKVQEVLGQLDGYVVAANINSNMQTVIGGATKAVEEAVAHFQKLGARAVFLPVSHAFHTEIVAPAAQALRSVLSRLDISAPKTPLITNVTGGFYPAVGEVKEQMLDLLAKQVHSPVQFVKGLESLYAAGARIFVEVGPKKVLASFVEDVLDRPDVTSICTNQPKKGELESFSEALCALYAAGLGAPKAQRNAEPIRARDEAPRYAAPAPVTTPAVQTAPTAPVAGSEQGHLALGKLFASFLQEGASTFEKHFGALGVGGGRGAQGASASAPTAEGSVVISGASVGLPGRSKPLFAADNFDRILRGENLIDAIDSSDRERLVNKNVVRLIKGSDGSARIETISDPALALKLAGQRGAFDLGAEFGVESERREAFDITTEMAVGSAILALRDAGIPLVRRYKTTSKGTFLPDRWVLPESMADETGVIFASAFPGYNALLDEVNNHHADLARHRRLRELNELRTKATGDLAQVLDSRIADLKAEIAANPYQFDRKFLFHTLSMGHSQLAELIGARGPNTQVNAACASGAQALSLARDWIRLGRCRRVIVVSADDVTSKQMVEWVGTGFLASGAASTEADVSNAALPFDRRRHGLIMGMGTSGIVIEAEDALRERGMRGISEVLTTTVANSAFHGSRLDVEHICQVMEQIVSTVERERGLDRHAIAGETVFVSHETYTPARGGSAAAEIHSLRRTFGQSANKLLVANTKGFTGHPMGAGIEEAVTVKILETGKVPPVANLREPDPELGDLRLSQGGSFPNIKYALRLAAGFGSQVVISMLQKVEGPRVADGATYQRWLEAHSGRPGARTYVEKNALRVVDEGAPKVQPARSTWTLGQGPTLRAEVAGAARSAFSAPAPVAAPVPAQPAAPAPVAPTPALAAAAPSVDVIAEKVLGVVAAKTGYPRDMLALDLDLEADLGIDTVKQAEIFAEVRSGLDIPRRDDLKLRDYPTLGAIIGLMRSMRPDLAAAPAPAAATAVAAPAPSMSAAAPVAGGTDPVAEKLLDVVAGKTGYPRDMLALDLDLEADLGIDTVKQAEIFAEVRSGFDIPRRDDLKLRDYPTLAALIKLIHDMRPDLPNGGGPTGGGGAPAPIAVPVSTPGAAAPAVASDPVAAKLLEVVAAKTGYPREMLDMDLDLEADLGIDTVKQAEIFAEVRSGFDIPRRDDLKLRDYPTLNALVGLIRGLRPDLPGAAPAPVAPAAATPSAAPQQAAPAPAAKGNDPVAEKLLEVVAAKTGYPREMLDMDLDLEADLGIDTVKQAEIFAEVRSGFDIPRRDDLKLRDYPTLNALVRLVNEMRGGATGAAPAAEATAAAPAAQAEIVTVDATGSKVAAHGAKRRVPTPVLRPELELCKETKASLEKGARVIVLPDMGGVADALGKLLKKRGVEILTLEKGDSVEAKVAEWKAQGVTGIYNLTALDVERDIVAAPHEEVVAGFDLRVKRVVDLCRRLLPELGTAGRFLVAGTRLGGLHGYGAEPASAPMGGAVVGFTKAMGQEYPDLVAKAVDFELEAKPKAIAEALVAETLRDPAVKEVGYAFGSRHSITLVETEFPAAAEGGLAFGPETVFVVTGAVGAITAAIGEDLAKASKGTFWLLDMAQLPDGKNPDLAKLGNRDAFLKDVFERLKAKGERPTPAAAEKVVMGVEREKAILDAVANIEKTGAKVNYRSVNLCDPAAVAKVIGEVKEKHGRIDALVHAAGMERSKLLTDKPQDEYNLVFDVKAYGLCNVLRAAQGMPINAMVCFSSIAGRFGNGGQTDYSAANDFLCKAGLAMARWRPETKAYAVDWTAWGGIGMAMRGSLPQIMKAAGIDMLDPRDGVPVVGRELRAGTKGEIVIGGSLGMMMQPPTTDKEGGVDVKAVAARIAASKHVMVSRVLGTDLYAGLTVETLLDPAKEPFLFDHQIEGTPVLPGVMGIEGFAEVAQLLLPGYRVDGLSDIHFEAPMKYYRNQPRPGLFRAQLMREDADTVRVELTFSSSRALATGEVQETRHYRGSVLMSRKPERNVKNKNQMKAKAKLPNADIYKVFFHGPAYQVLDQVEVTDKGVRSRFKANLPKAFGTESVTTLLAPRIIELCLQTAGIYELGKTGRMALPSAIEKVVAHAAPSEIAGLWAEVLPRAEGDNLIFDALVRDDEGRVFLDIKGYRTSALPAGMPADLLAPLQKPFKA